MHRELDIGAAGLHTDFADDLDSRIAHHLALAVGERLRRRDCDRVAGVHAHGIEVLDGADDDHVIGEIAHHLELVFLPSQDGFFDQHLVHRRKIKAAGHDLQQLLAVIGDAAA